MRHYKVDAPWRFAYYHDFDRLNPGSWEVAYYPFHEEWGIVKRIMVAWEGWKLLPMPEWEIVR